VNLEVKMDAPPDIGVGTQGASQEFVTEGDKKGGLGDPSGVKGQSLGGGSPP